jgi:dephospho-CoA kinase
MFMIVFLLGRPGSGKSNVARLIEMFAGDRGWFTHYTNDYEHLQKMFLHEKAECIPLERRNFWLTGPEERNGFDVIGFSVLVKVLEKMREEVEEVESESSEEDNILCLIEFARDSYNDALQLFGSNLLQDTHLIYLDVDLESCIERNHRRSDHFVSDEILRTYYRNDDWSRVMYNLQHNWDKCVIRNSGTLQDLKQEVKEWVDIHLGHEVVIPDGYVTVG